MPSRRSKKGSKRSKNTTSKDKEKDRKKRYEDKNPTSSRALVTVQKEDDPDFAINFYMALDQWYEDRKTQVRYICGQIEVAPTTGTVHFQGYVQLKRSQRISWWKKNIHPTANIVFQSVQDTTNENCRHYGIKPVDGCVCKVCVDERESPSRDPDYERRELGTFAPGQGFRTDVIGTIDAIRSGATELELLETGHEKTIMQYPKMYAKVKELTHEFFRDTPRELNLLCGWPRTGKGVTIKNILKPLGRTSYGKKMSSKGEWFNGYNGERNLIIQEFEGGIDRARFRDIFDTWEDALVEVKGMSIPMSADTVWITSNKHPMHWWKNMTDNEREGLKGRITRVYYFSKDAEIGVPTEIFEGDRLTYFMEHPDHFDTIKPTEDPPVNNNWTRSWND